MNELRATTTAVVSERPTGHAAEATAAPRVHHQARLDAPPHPVRFQRPAPAPPRRSLRCAECRWPTPSDEASRRCTGSRSRLRWRSRPMPNTRGSHGHDRKTLAGRQVSAQSCLSVLTVARPPTPNVPGTTQGGRPSGRRHLRRRWRRRTRAQCRGARPSAPSQLRERLAVSAHRRHDRPPNAQPKGYASHRRV